VRQTLCEYVMTSAFIDRDGEVYACCHKQPVSYGNIRDAPLAELLAGERARRQRDDSLSGALSCHAACNLLTYNSKRRPSAEPASFPLIRKLTLSLGWFCNINCVMCPQDHAERQFLSVDALLRHVDWPSVGEIICEGGEPLAAPTVPALWDHLIGIGKKLNFVTNGLVISQRTAERIAAHSDYVYISFNAASEQTYARVNRGGSWQKLLRNLHWIQQARQSAGSGLKIIGHFTIVEQNLAELPDFLDLAAELGLDIVNFGYNRIEQFGAPIDRLLAEDPALRAALTARLRDAARRTERKIRIDPSRLQYLGLLEAEDPLQAVHVWPSGM